jgi:hypothetical protein
MDARRLVYLGVVAVMAALVFYAFSPPAWEKQFRATGDALEKARSWHMTVIAREPRGDTRELDQEINCPADYHTVQRHLDKDGAQIAKDEVEIWSLGDRHVIRQNEKLMNTPDRVGQPRCGAKEMLELGNLPPFKLVFIRGRAVRGDKKMIDGRSCRVWDVQMPEGNGWGDLYTMCVDDENNLPLEMITKTGDVIAHASKWNERIELPQPPDVPPPTNESGAQEIR